MRPPVVGSVGARTGMWRTDAPISSDQFDAQSARLQQVLQALGSVGGVVIRDLSVWVDGVEWRFDADGILGDFGSAP